MIDTQTHPHQLFIDNLNTQADWFRNNYSNKNFLSDYEFVIKNGFFMNNHFKIASPQEVKNLIKKYKCPEPQPKECYYNSYKLWLESALRKEFRFVYCEGKARKTYHASSISFTHGWLFDLKTNKIIDLTWDDAEVCLYYGVPFSHEYTIKHAEMTNHPEMLDSDYKWGFRLSLEKDIWTDFRYDFGPELNKNYFGV